MCIRTPYLFGNKPAFYDSVMKTHATVRIFKFSPIHASVIYQFPWIRWIHWNPVLFSGNLIVSKTAAKELIAVDSGFPCELQPYILQSLLLVS